MSVILFANSATSTVQSPIGSGATSVNLSPGAGAIFPNPSGDEYYVGTFTDAATGLVKEVVHCTAMTGDVATIVRGQEGTSAVDWNAGDHFDNLWTAGSAAQMLQQGQLPPFNNYGVDTGSVNAMAVALSPVPASLASLIGTPIFVKVAHTNTANNPTLNVNGFGPHPVLAWSSSGGVALAPGSLAINQIVMLVWDGTQFQYLSEVPYAGLWEPYSAFAATHGYQYLPNGLVMQWGSHFYNEASDAPVITFPIPFTQKPNCQVTVELSGGAGQLLAHPIILAAAPVTSSGSNWVSMTIQGIVWNSGSAAWNNIVTSGNLGTVPFMWQAVGPYL